MPIIGTSFLAIYPTVRAILGDRQVHGNWMYTQATINDAIRACFLLGRQPVNYQLDNMTDPTQSAFVVGPLVPGDDYALVIYETALILLGGEDGAGMIRTRSIWSQDKGDRKRNLLDELRQKVYEVRDGGAIFGTYQSLIQFLGIFQKDGEGLQSIAAYMELDVISRMPSIAI